MIDASPDTRDTLPVLLEDVPEASDAAPLPPAEDPVAKETAPLTPSAEAPLRIATAPPVDVTVSVVIAVPLVNVNELEL